MSGYPKIKTTSLAVLVSVELDEDDAGDPRQYEVRVLDEESTDAILVSSRQRDGQKLVFMAGCWPALREAIDRLIAEHRESPE